MVRGPQATSCRTARTIAKRQQHGITIGHKKNDVARANRKSICILVDTQLEADKVAAKRSHQAA